MAKRKPKCTSEIWYNRNEYVRKPIGRKKTKMPNNKATKIPPKVRKTGGRPAIDWGILYGLWLQSGETKRHFLSGYGISLQSSTTKQMIAAWNRDEKATRARMAQLAKSQQRPDQRISSLWEIVQQWRGGQAESDYKTAHVIRQHIQLTLNNAIQVDDKGVQHTKLTARDLVNLADAAETVQKIQRLALGMTTDNVGVVPPSDDSNVESDPEVNCPVFIVEVSDNGKFKRARPRQIK